MTVRKLTQEDMNWLFTSPACDDLRHNTDCPPGRCAEGKFQVLNIPETFSCREFLVSTLNNTGNRTNIYQKRGDSSTYGPDSPFWPKHEAALKLGLQYLLEDGIIEIEDQLAADFALTKKNTLVEA